MKPYETHGNRCLGEHQGSDDVDAEHVHHHARLDGDQAGEVRRPSVIDEATKAVRGGYGLQVNITMSVIHSISSVGDI